MDFALNFAQQDIRLANFHAFQVAILQLVNLGNYFFFHNMICLTPPFLVFGTEVRRTA